MTTTVGDFLAALRRRVGPDRAAGWDTVGLQIGDPAALVATVAVCHEITPLVTDAVVAAGPDLAVTYHPLLFRPTTTLVEGPTAGGRAWRLASAGIAVAATHTDFDAAPGGTADSLAAALGLGDVKPFGPVEPADQVKVITFAPEEAVDQLVATMAAAGAGVIGSYTSCSFRVSGRGSFHPGEGAAPVSGAAGRLNLEPETRVEMVAPKSKADDVVAALVSSHPYEEPAFDVYAVASNHGFVGRVGRWDGTVSDLADLAASELATRGLRVAGQLDRTLSTVAVVPGSGASFIRAAGRRGADAIVTGDVDHHRAAAALEMGIAVVDPGHAASELPGMRSLVDLVKTLEVEVVDLTGDGSGPWSR